MAKLSEQRSEKSSSKTSSGATTSNDSSSSSSSAAAAATKVKKRARKNVSRDSPPQRSSVYRGVTRHRWTGRYEAHLWDKNCWNESQNKKGRQVYLGAYDEEEAAAHAYDLAALKYWGQGTVLNFPLSTYEEQIKEMEVQSKEEYIGSLRRKSSGFARGVSKYRGVARHHHNGRWEARIGRVFGNKYLYLGTYATQEEAATAYDMAAIEYRGLNAVTNFDLSRYAQWLKPSQTNGMNSQPNPNLSPSPSPDADPNPDVNSIHNGGHEVSLSPSSTAQLPPPRATASSALGLLLQSSKFKEMLERTAATDCLSTPSTESDPPRRSFPDDIQTYFDGHDSGCGFADGDDGIFADLNSFGTPMFQCELDAC